MAFPLKTRTCVYGRGMYKDASYGIKFNAGTVSLAEPLRPRSPAQVEAEKEVVGKMLRVDVLEPKRIAMGDDISGIDTEKDRRVANEI